MIGNGVERKASPQAAQTSSPAPSPDAQDGYGPPHPLDGLMQRIREVIEYANFYVEARKDQMRSTVRALIFKAVLGVVAAFAAVTVIVVATVFLMSGIAQGLGWLFGERFWLGELVTGLAVFLIVGMGAFLGIKLLTRKARERTIKKYEHRQKQQRDRFGNSAADRAQQLRESHRG